MPTGKSKAGRDELTSIVQRALSLGTKKEAEHTIDTVISALEEVLLNNLANDQFVLKLNSFGKFTIRHKPGIYRKIPFTGETKMTNAKRKVKFVTLGILRQREVVTQEKK
jgi:nucleoid DNA-binding protein